MRCFICDAEIEEPRRDHRDGSWRPCHTCEGVIAETVDDYDRDEDDEYVSVGFTELDEFEEEIEL